MKTFVATVLATIASVSLAAAPAATPKPDLAAYHVATQKAAADYKVAAAKCGAVSGNAKTVCAEEARAARAHSEVDAVAQYNNTPKTLGKARSAAADADYALAKAKCAEMSGADKDRCVGDAKSAHAAALKPLRKTASRGHCLRGTDAENSIHPNTPPARLQTFDRRCPHLLL